MCRSISACNRSRAHLEACMTTEIPACTQRVLPAPCAALAAYTRGSSSQRHGIPRHSRPAEQSATISKSRPHTEMRLCWQPQARRCAYSSPPSYVCRLRGQSYQNRPYLLQGMPIAGGPSTLSSGLEALYGLQQTSRTVLRQMKPWRISKSWAVLAGRSPLHISWVADREDKVPNMYELPCRNGVNERRRETKGEIETEGQTDYTNIHVHVYIRVNIYIYR